MATIFNAPLSICSVRPDLRRKSPSGNATMMMKGRGVAKYKGTQMREKKLTEMIEAKVMEATAVCEGEGRRSDECKVAWDEVEEVSQAKADLRLKLAKHEDPLESFCTENPQTDECVVEYDRL